MYVKKKSNKNNRYPSRVWLHSKTAGVPLVLFGAAMDQYEVAVPLAKAATCARR
jgi:hypothetical protein